MSTPATRLNGAQVTSLVSCPVASGAAGIWWDGNTTGPKWRKADGTDVTLGSGGGGTQAGATTSPNVPYASGANTLADSELAFNSGTHTFSVGASTNFDMSASAGTFTLPTGGVSGKKFAAGANTMAFTANPGATSDSFTFTSATTPTSGSIAKFSDGTHDVEISVQASSYPKITTSGGNLGFFNSSTTGMVAAGATAINWYVNGSDLMDLSATTLTCAVSRVLHTVAQTTTISSTDNIITVDTSSGRSFTLPAATNVGRELVFVDSTNTAGANNITITPNGTDTINGVNAAIVINANSGVKTLRNIATNKWIAY